MTSNNSVKMEVDNPAILKRCSSAPMINDISTRPTMTSSTSTTTTSRETTSYNIFSSAPPRTRRFSASFTSQLHSPPVQVLPWLAPRINQLRQEECLDVVVRETAHEKELNSTMVMSQSWEDLTIVGEKSENMDSTNKPRVCDPLHLHLPVHSPICSSPSPTRTLAGRQCFSPFKNSMSPSPTRTTFTTRRSLSPIAMRPSSLGPVKRKFELDDNEPPAKRGSLLLAQSRLDVMASPLPGSLSSVGTPDSLSSGDSPGGFNFRSEESPNSVTDHPMQDLAKPDPSPT
uniref:Protein FAM122A n=1 Tax=Clastoptera arizonana TaxID=38151 RepID=A0A1B6CM33_9HEMI